MPARAAPPNAPSGNRGSHQAASSR
ncbi:hypothetical protein GBAR_LOCUS22555 [Geodia barretti]|uniref:Uncharacterized protein n=1 Tax=Geodia barretti TaxID=519541 RepID=A0AA35T407_GEOBA|nr:hypothetical protein GBAR_LOCUS22555 [Geodia barretti]